MDGLIVSAILAALCTMGVYFVRTGKKADEEKMIKMSDKKSDR